MATAAQLTADQNPEGAQAETAATHLKMKQGMFRSAAKSNTEAFKIFEDNMGVSIAEYENALDDAPARLLILATSFGRTLAQSIKERREYTHLVRQEAGQEAHITASLMEVNDVPVIDYWLGFAKQCKKFQPITQSVYVLTNQDNYKEHIAWCENAEFTEFNTDHIFSNGRTTRDERVSQTEDIRIFREKSGWMGNLHVVDADYLFEPTFNLQRVVEHSAVLDCDCITVMAPPQDAPAGVFMPEMFELHGVAEVDVDQHYPSVVGVDLAERGDGLEHDDRCICPLYYFKASSLDLLGSMFDTASDGTKAKQGLSPFIKFLHEAGRPMKCHIVEYYFNVRSLDAFLFADQFFAYYGREELKKKKLLGMQDTDSNIEFTMPDDEDAKAAMSRATSMQMKTGGALTRTQSVRKQKTDAEYSFRQQILDYAHRFFSAAVAKKTDAEKEERVPERFSDASKFRHKSKTQHPVYRTSNNDYGRKAPAQQDMPMQWNGLHGEFTESFNGLKVNFTGFNTSRTTSRIHTTYDDF